MTLLFATVVTTAVLLPGTEPVDPLSAWTERVFDSGGLSVETIEEWRTIVDGFRRPEPKPKPKPSPVRASIPALAYRSYDVEAWRPLVSVYFPAENVDRALDVLACESNGDPLAKNPRSSAAGLFQFIRSTWDWTAGKLGLASYDAGGPYDPESAIRAAAELSNGGSDWSHWVCKPRR